MASLNLQAALIANNSLSNIEFPFLYPKKAGNDLDYTKNASKPIG